jgi:hypothetical protein
MRDCSPPSVRIAPNRCEECGKDVRGTFTHIMTLYEFWLSGMCETCQDEGWIDCVGLELLN